MGKLRHGRVWSGSGAAQDRSSAGGARGPSDALAEFQVAVAKPECCKSLKIKGAVGRGCARACPRPAPRGNWEDLAADPAGSWHRAREMPASKGLGAVPPPSVPSVPWGEAPCRSGDIGAELGCRWVGWVPPWWHPEEFQRGAELEEPWGHCPCAPQHTQGALGKLRQSLPEWPCTRLWVCGVTRGVSIVPPPGHAGQRGGQRGR